MIFDLEQTPLQIKNEFFEIKKRVLTPILLASSCANEVRHCLDCFNKIVDQLIKNLWLKHVLPESFSLVAVGGYGRADLYPYSDVDILILMPDEVREEDVNLITAFTSSCWDVGLEIGSSVRSLHECRDDLLSDITIATSLLESRFIVGNYDLYQDLTTLFECTLDKEQFFIGKRLEQEQRHNKYENTAYSLEPDCKESPGAWRDLHILTWVAKTLGLGSDWPAMQGSGFATDRECQQIQRNADFLMMVRARLHLIAGRRENRLIFDFQHSLAQCFGQEALGSDAFMQSYYQTAKSVLQLNQILLLAIQEKFNPSVYEAVAINERFNDRGGLLEVAQPDIYHKNPQTILETFVLFTQIPTVHGLSVLTLRSLYNAIEVMNDTFRDDRINKNQFLSIVKSPSGITTTFRLMNQTSVLGQYLPIFGKVVGKMQHDLFHVYTVDQHILMVVRNLRRFFIADHSHEFPFCSKLASEWGEPWLLYLAALFHDIAKGRGGSHSQLGAIDAQQFCVDHRLTSDETALIVFLVREHLTMSQIAQNSDIADPDVIAKFAHTVGDERRLTALYLFTVADIRGTSPKVWNSWKAHLLEDLYHSTLRSLGGYMPSVKSEIENRKSAALTLLAFQAQPYEVQKPLWHVLEVSYFMRQSASDIAWHAKILSRKVNNKDPVVCSRMCINHNDGIEVMVYALAQPQLFARICAYFDKQGVSVIEAKIHTTRHHYALDTFRVVAPSWVERYREYASLLETGLLEYLLEPVYELPTPKIGRLSRRVKYFPVVPSVTLNPDEKAQQWLLQIAANDRGGLLYTIALVLVRFDLSLNLAKINTLGERVEDAFLIQGLILGIEKIRLEFEEALLLVIGTSR